MKTFKNFTKESVKPTDSFLHLKSNYVPMPPPKILFEKILKKAPFDNWAAQNDNAHLGKTLKQVHNNIEINHPHREIPNRIEHLRYGGYSRDLNQHLHESYADKKAPHKNYHSQIKDLDNALGHHSLNSDLHVYSGVGFHPGKEAAKDPEHKLHLPAYTSTSISKHVAPDFAREMDEHGEKKYNEETGMHNNIGGHAHVLHVHLKAGQRGAYLGSHSHLPDEHEFTLPRHTTLKLHPTPDTHANKYGVKVHVWHAHVVPNEEKN